MSKSSSTTHHHPGRVRVSELIADRRVRRAFEVIDQGSDRFTAEHIRICEIPAPPFLEAVRGDYLESRFRELGLYNVHRDEVGNVIGSYPGTDHERPVIVVSAHLDTVFPPGTDVRVRRVGSRPAPPA